MGLGFGTRLTTGTMKKGMLVMLRGHDAKALGLEKTIGVIDSLQRNETYHCIVKATWSANRSDWNSLLAMKASELIYFGIAKEKNKRCPSSVFEWRPKTAPMELIG